MPHPGPYKFKNREAEWRKEYNETHKEDLKIYDTGYNNAYYFKVTKPKRKRLRKEKRQNQKLRMYYHIY